MPPGEAEPLVGLRRSLARTVATALVLTTLAGCGKKGPPLAPLRLVPAAPAELSARRSGDDVELRFLLPTANVNGPGPIDLAKIEVYAITIGPGGVTPPNRDLLTTARVVGTIAVRPPPVEGEGSDTPSAPGAPPDTRPAPGDRVTFVDQLTAEKLKPIAAPNPATKSTGPGELKPVPPLGKPDPAAPAIRRIRASRIRASRIRARRIRASRSREPSRPKRLSHRPRVAWRCFQRGSMRFAACRNPAVRGRPRRGSSFPWCRR